MLYESDRTSRREGAKNVNRAPERKVAIVTIPQYQDQEMSDQAIDAATNTIPTTEPVTA